MSVRRPGKLAAMTVVAAVCALVSHVATAQFYYPPAPPARMYYPPPPMQPGDLPMAARPYDRPASAQSDDREDREDRRINGRESRPVISRQDREDDDDRDDRDNRPIIRRYDRPAEATRENQNGNPSASTTTPVRAVSLRDGPSGGDAIIGTLRPGMQLDVLGTKGGWVQVRSSAGTGWAYGSYLAIGAHGFGAAPTSDVAASPAPAADVGNTAAAKPSESSSSRATSAAAKPPGAANPALAGGGPALAGGGPALGTDRWAEPSRRGLASQITSP